MMISSCQRSVARNLQFPALGIRRSIPASSRRLYSSSQRCLKVSEEVQDAVATGKPVVALETTIYTHGRRDMVVR
jgi:pseudouridine-5'-phosphate glycosidase/pseudouridine-5'-phosphate glycosidase/pseudouridine kinase